MPSVIAYWSGQLRDVAKREELLLRMTDLAKLSHRFFREPRPEVRKFDQTLTGDVLLSSHILAAPPSSPKLTRIEENLFTVPSLTLTGLEFRLYDGRELYPGDDRVSFAFTVDEDPELDGLLVYVDGKEECPNYADERLKRADFYLGVPHIHLRYYLEKWTDSLMGWLKYHYIPELVYWRGESIWTHPNALNSVFAPHGNYEYFEMLKKRFEGEVEKWQGISEEAVRFWRPLRGQPFDENA